MTTIIQNVGLTVTNVATAGLTLTVAATGASNALFVEFQLQNGSAALLTSAAVTDNKSNTWVLDYLQTIGLSQDRTIAHLSCLSPATAGVTSINITTTPDEGASGYYGCFAFQEVSGGLSALDQTGTASVSTAGPTSATVTASAVDMGSTDFVCSVISLGGGVIEGYTVPPTGYTSAQSSPDDSTTAAGEIAYRINSSAVTDSCTWNWTDTGASGVLTIVSYKVGTGAPTKVPYMNYALPPTLAQ